MKIKNKNKMEKKILIVETITVLGIFVYLFFANMPSQIYPLNGMTIINPDFVFEIENGEEVILSVDESFANPVVLKEGSETVLPPGTYYWKVKGRFVESEIKTFTIQGHVGLNLKEREENYELENAGNMDLEINKENSEGTSEFDLGVGESLEFEKDDSGYSGEQK